MESLTEIASPRERAHELDAATARATRLFRDRIEESFRPSRVLIFGSRARGSPGTDSDADVAVVLGGDDGDRWAIARDTAAFDVLIETGVLIDPAPVWDAELMRPDQFINPALIHAILRDGVAI